MAIISSNVFAKVVEDVGRKPLNLLEALEKEEGGWVSCTKDISSRKNILKILLWNK